MANKKRLIDANGAKRQIIAFATGCHSEVISVESVVMMLNQADTIDAVEVVRCRNCKKTSPSVTGVKQAVWCREFHAYMKIDDFCSYGERMNDNV